VYGRCDEIVWKYRVSAIAYKLQEKKILLIVVGSIVFLFLVFMLIMVTRGTPVEEIPFDTVEPISTVVPGPAESIGVGVEIELPEPTEAIETLAPQPVPRF
jgi:hypothetical protein